VEAERLTFKFLWEKKCIFCGQKTVKKNGKKRGRQSFQCITCKKQFFLKRTSKKATWIAKAYSDYSFGKQSLRQLQETYHVSIPTIRKYFESYVPYTGEIILVPEKALSVVFDVTFLTRTNGIVVFRAEGRTLYWREVATESRASVAYALDALDVITERRYASFTIDGKPGILQLLQERYPSVPIQLCYFHQKQIVTRYVTNNPKSACGRAVHYLMMGLTRITQEEFHQRLQSIKETYTAYLQERNERNQYTHRSLRSALRSLTRNLPFLFTFQQYPHLQIPTTTNTCDGSFAHWKQKVKLHRGLRKHRRTKMFNSFLSASQNFH